MDNFSLALGDVCAAWSALRPPNRISVSQGVAENLMIVRPGGGSGPWSPDETPYMVEPMDMLASRRHSAVCFVGPSQTGKTVGLLDGWMTHCVLNDPGDMLMVQMTQDKAREFSKQRIDRAIRNSPNLRAMQGANSRDDNLHDKQFRNGMWLKLAWPTGSNLSSTSYRYVAGTDYDRWEDDIDGEGDGFTLMGKRITTFLSRGMVGVESSPGRPIVDPAWEPSSAHEAPPVGGILGIYNRSDRRRQYWQCPHCREYMQARPGLSLFNLPTDDELLEDVRTLNIDRFAREHARVICPNGCEVAPSFRKQMNLGGRWLADGLTIDSRGRVSGTARTSSIAGYWLGGCAAAYVSWETLIQKHLQALLEYALNGSELQLQTTANTDQGVPYMSRHLAETKKGGASPQDRAERSLEQYIVPDGARFLLATVDVQGGRNARFIVQVHAIGPYGEEWLIDRYAITESNREGYGGKAPIDPAGHAEDWDLITERVVNSTYRTSNPNVELKVYRTAVDTGGEDGVTERAYAWFRRLRAQGLHQRVKLTKGDHGDYDWMVRETKVGGPKGGKGDVPLALLNSNLWKDVVHACLQRTTPGPGYYHFPEPRSDKNPDGWLLATFFDELFAEVRLENGKYSQLRKRNEALDLCYMTKALCSMLRVDTTNFWVSPPAWARELDRNSEAITTVARRELQGRPVAAAKPLTLTRSSRRSNYLA